MWPPDKEYLDPPKARRDKEGFLPEAFQGSMALQPDFRLLAPSTVRDKFWLF